MQWDVTSYQHPDAIPILLAGSLTFSDYISKRSKKGFFTVTRFPWINLFKCWNIKGKPKKEATLYELWVCIVNWLKFLYSYAANRIQGLHSSISSSIVKYLGLALCRGKYMCVGKVCNGFLEMSICFNTRSWNRLLMKRMKTTLPCLSFMRTRMKARKRSPKMLWILTKKAGMRSHLMVLVTPKGAMAWAISSLQALRVALLVFRKFGVRMW